MLVWFQNPSVGWESGSQTTLRCLGCLTAVALAFTLPVFFVLFFQDFHFRQLRKVSIGDPAVPPELRYSLLCTSNEFGLTFVGCGGGMFINSSCFVNEYSLCRGTDVHLFYRWTP